MKDANDLMVVALAMYRVLENGKTIEKARNGRPAVYEKLDLIEKAAVMAIVSELFKAEINAEAKRQNDEKLQRMRSPASFSQVADEYQQ